MKRLNPGLIIGILFCLVALPAQARFWDVTDNHPYGEAIDELMATGVIRGYEDRSFRPERAVSRIELTKIIVSSLFSQTSIESCLDKMSVQPTIASKMRFDDISYFDWYGPTLCTALLAGLVEGHPDGYFRPHDGVNFAEGAKIFAKAFDLEAEANHQDPTQIWYKPYVNDLGLIGGIPPTIRQFGQPLNRGEVAEIMYRINNRHRVPSVTSRLSLQYEDIAGVKTTANYINKDLRLSFVYPIEWPTPYLQDRNIYTLTPAGTAMGRVYLGEKKTDCYGFGECIERYMYIDTYPQLDLESAGLEIRLNPDILITEDTLLNDVWTMTYASVVDGCENLHALIITLDYSYRLTAECTNEDEDREAEFRQILQGIRLLKPASRSLIK